MDLKRYSNRPGFIQFWNVFIFNPGFRFVFFLRMCTLTSKFSPLGMLGRVFFKRMQRRFGFQIPHRISIGPGFFLGHFGGIVINQGVKIGSNCNVAQGVTIGYVSRGKKKGCPTIGDRVWIGANAVVVGNIKIGNAVLIAPLSYVIDDIPDNAVVMGNPATIINYNGSTGYLKNLV